MLILFIYCCTIRNNTKIKGHINIKTRLTLIWEITIIITVSIAKLPGTHISCSISKQHSQPSSPWTVTLTGTTVSKMTYKPNKVGQLTQFCRVRR